MKANIDARQSNVNSLYKETSAASHFACERSDQRKRGAAALGNTPIPIHPPRGMRPSELHYEYLKLLEADKNACYERRKSVDREKALNPNLVHYPNMGRKGTMEARENRRERYDLLTKIRPLIFKQGKEDGLQFPMDWHRVGTCRAVNHAESIEYWLDPNHKKAFSSGMRVCGSVWACPVCSEKIMARRREQVEQVVSSAIDQGYKNYFVTFTLSHNKDHGLGELLQAFKDGLASMRKGSPWKKFTDRTGYVGLIRAFEILHGENGWHPHTHEIWFTEKGMDIESEKRSLIDRWYTRMSKLGLAGSNEASIKFFLEKSIKIEEVKADGNQLSDYLCKMGSSSAWGAAHELTSAAKKQNKGISPLQLAHDWFMYRNHPKLKSSAQYSGHRYLEYVKETRERRLKSLFISNKVRSLFGLHEVVDSEDDDNGISEESLKEDQLVTSDQEESRMVHEKKESAIHIGKLDPITHKIIVERNLEPKLLEMIEDGGTESFNAYLEHLGYGSSLNYY